MIPTSDNGWRWALAIGAVPAAYAVLVRFGLPESVRFLEQRGREEKADAAVEKFEVSAGITPPPRSMGAQRHWCARSGSRS